MLLLMHISTRNLSQVNCQSKPHDTPPERSNPLFYNNRMPKIEKDCHSFTISAEREKHREMMKGNQQGQGGGHGSYQNKGYQNQPSQHHKTGNPFYNNKQVPMPPGGMPPQQGAYRSRGVGHHMNQPKAPTQHPSNPKAFFNNQLQENLQGTRMKPGQREGASHPNPQTAKSDSTQDTDTLNEMDRRHEGHGALPHSEYEKIQKFRCTEAAKNGA